MLLAIPTYLTISQCKKSSCFDVRNWYNTSYTKCIRPLPLGLNKRELCDWIARSVADNRAVTLTRAKSINSSVTAWPTMTSVQPSKGADYQYRLSVQGALSPACMCCSKIPCSIHQTTACVPLLSNVFETSEYCIAFYLKSPQSLVSLYTAFCLIGGVWLNQTRDIPRALLKLV